MINVCYAKVFPFLEENTFLTHLDKMEEEWKNRILRIRDPQARSRSMTAYWLLQRMLCEKRDFFLEEPDAFLLSWGEGGKPCLVNRGDIQFNLSHSGDYACCAIGDLPIGVDIQKKMPVKGKLAERFFTAADNGKLQECSEEEREELFFRMWSIKESYVKLTGKGIGKGLASFEIDWRRGQIQEEKEDEPAAYFTEQTALTGYSFCVCTKEAGAKIQWEEIQITT